MARHKPFSSRDGEAAIVLGWEGLGEEASLGGESERVALCQAVPVWLLNTFVSRKLVFAAKPGEKNNYESMIWGSKGQKIFLLYLLISPNSIIIFLK